MWLTSVIQDYLDFFPDSINYYVFHVYVGKSEIVWNLEVKIEISVCTAIINFI